MEREILFRGMTFDNKFIEGYLFKIWSDIYIVWGTTNEVPNMIGVIPETVGQFTGLKDKDGVKIFEGDIIKRIDSDTKFIVVFNGGSFCVQDSENLHHNLGLLDSISNCSTIVGNIHQNKELIL